MKPEKPIRFSKAILEKEFFQEQIRYRQSSVGSRQDVITYWNNEKVKVSHERIRS